MPMPKCPKCNSALVQDTTWDPYDPNVWVCMACSQRYRPRKRVESKPTPLVAPELRNQQVTEKKNGRKVKAHKGDAQKRATKRYRDTELAKTTLRRIQLKWRRSPQGKQTLQDYNTKQKIINRLAKKMVLNEFGDCPIHNEPAVRKDGKCISCLKV